MKTLMSFLMFGMMMTLQAKGPCGGCCQAAGEGPVTLKAPVEAWVRLWTDEIAARDLYAALDAQTQRPVFQNIGRAELHHRDMIADLLTRGGHAVPEEPAPGSYGDADIDAVYAELLALGRQGELQAFQAGAAFEELDITELEHELAREVLSDAERGLLTALRDASVRHLKAFRRQIVRLGGTPERRYLSEERLRELLGE